jgi:outer membrane protein TolC
VPWIVAVVSGGGTAALAQNAVPSARGTAGIVCPDDLPPRQIELNEAVAQSLTGAPDLTIAEQNEIASRADVTIASAAFLPNVQFIADEQHYVPESGPSPVVVVGNNVLGGAQSKSAYASLGMNWNLLSSGRDLAALHGAKAARRAASSGVDSQLDDTLTAVLQAYADLYEAEIATRAQASTVSGLKLIQARAEERYANGHGTTVAIGEARNAALNAQETLFHECRSLLDKSAALAQAIGLHLGQPDRLAAGVLLPAPLPASGNTELKDAVDSDPAVVAAKERIAAAEAKRDQAMRAFGPTVSLAVRRDYLGQSIDSLADANHHIAPFSYQVGLSFQQPLLPLAAEAAQVGKARAEVRRAQAEYERTRLEVEARGSSALSALREAELSYLAARSSEAESERVLALTESLFRAGRADLDSVEHARMDRDKAEADVETFESRRALARWAALRALQPAQFAPVVFRQLQLSPPADELHRSGWLW